MWFLARELEDFEKQYSLSYLFSGPLDAITKLAFYEKELDMAKLKSLLMLGSREIHFMAHHISWTWLNLILNCGGMVL